MRPQEFSRVIFPETRFDFDSLKAIGLFCGAGLAGSFLLAAYGLDLNPGFLQFRGTAEDQRWGRRKLARDR
jgi:hypothetical protein